MANIKLNLPCEPFSGQIVTFEALCDSSEITDGLIIGEDIYTVCDALGNCVTGISGVWIKDAIVSVVLNVDKKTAFIQNAASTASTSEVIKGVTVLSSGWIDETETTALFRYRISNSAILENTSVDVLFKVDDYTEDEPSSLVRATNGGVLAATTANTGYVDIYSTAQLDTDLVCDLVLTQLKVV